MANQILVVLDANAAKQNMSVTADPSGSLVGSSCITDAVTGVKQTVGQPQNGDANNLSTSNASLAAAIEMMFNGTSFDRRRGNVDLGSIQTLAAQGTGTANSTDQTNFNHKGVQIGVNVTAFTGSPTLTISIQGKDVASGQYYTLLASASISVSGTGFYLLTVFPGVTPSSTSPNFAAAQVLPRTWRVSCAVGGSGTVTAGIGASLVG